MCGNLGTSKQWVTHSINPWLTALDDALTPRVTTRYNVAGGSAVMGSCGLLPAGIAGVVVGADGGSFGVGAGTGANDNVSKCENDVTLSSRVAAIFTMMNA